MLIAAALRALAPFSLVAGSPIFHMLSGSTSISSTPRPPRQPAANDGQVSATVHCFMAASTTIRHQLHQRSLLAGTDLHRITAHPTCPAPSTGPSQAPSMERPIDRIRRPRRRASRRRVATALAMSARTPTVCVPVQRCRAQAANEAAIKMYWAKPSSVERPRGMCWAMSGSMADICAELDRLVRLAHQAG